MKLVNIGFGNMINAARLIAVVSPDSAPIKRIVQESKERGTLIDATQGYNNGQRPCCSFISSVRNSCKPLER